MSCSIGDSLSRSENHIRLLETHDTSSAAIVRSVTSSDGSTCFDGQWVSGLTQTTILGVPDTELITPLARARLISHIETTKSHRDLCTAFDADSGGPIAEIPALVKLLASKGVSMIIIEDKEVFEPGKKVNSLATSSASQGQASPMEFAKVMAAFKRAKDYHGLSHILITARIESFTCRRVIKSDPVAEKASVEEALCQALERAFIYLEAGADAIMIHSKSKDPGEVLSFLRQFRVKDKQTPLVVVPTTYGSTNEDVLYEAGANVIIYANHLMRAKIQSIAEYIDSGSSSIHQVCPSSLYAALSARNFGYLLKSLQNIRAASPTGRLAPALDDFLNAAERVSGSAMEDTAQKLLDCKEACAADHQILPVKDLLTVNGVHLSEIGRQQVRDNALINRLLVLMSSLRDRFSLSLRTTTA